MSQRRAFFVEQLPWRNHTSAAERKSPAEAITSGVGEVARDAHCRAGVFGLRKAAVDEGNERGLPSFIATRSGHQLERVRCERGQRVDVQRSDSKKRSARAIERAEARAGAPPWTNSVQSRRALTQRLRAMRVAA